MIDKKKALFTAYAYSFMIAFAITGTMFSTALPRIIEDYSLSLTQAGLFSVFTSMGNIGAMILTGILGDRYHKSVLMGVMFLGIGGALVLIGFMPPFPALLCFFVILGIFTSSLNLIVTAYVSDLYGKFRAKYINLVHMFFGIGSLLGPLYPMILKKLGFHWKYSYLFLAAAVGGIGISYFLVMVRIKEPDLEIEIGKKVWEREERISEKCLFLFRNKGMFALCIMSFLYMGGHQNTFSTWFQTYLQTENSAVYSAEFTSICMTAYWIGMVISRMISAGVSDRVSPRKCILFGSLGGVCVLGIGMFLKMPMIWLLVVILLGAFTGAIYPLTFAISCAWFPDASAKVSSVVGVFTSVGGMVCGWLVGRIANTVSFSLAMFIPWLSLAVVSLIVWKCFPKEDAAK